MIEDFSSYWVVPLFVVGTALLWFLDRPGPWYRWKVACLTALTSAAVGLVVNQVISHIWVRERPFLAHPGDAVLLGAPSFDPSFPSDHATASFAIAVSVALVAGRRAGTLFLAAAVAVALSRIVVGLHYPSDVVGGALIGTLAALAVFAVAGRRWAPLVRLLSRVSDPLVRPAWRALDAQRRRRLDPSSG